MEFIPSVARELIPSASEESRFGDDLTNELVDWFNSVDATYQSSLREINEINFARFDAKLEQRIAGVDARIDGLERKMETRFAEQREAITAQLSAFESRMTRWMVSLWASTMLAFVGLLVAVLRTK